jgi:uncharacterized protein (TIGR02679 family)
MNPNPAQIPIDAARLRKLLDAPECHRLLARLRRRLENGEPLIGALLLPEPTPQERAYFAALLGGRPSRGASLRVDLDELTACLRHGELCGSLTEAMDLLFGPIVNLRAQRETRAALWVKMFESAREKIEGHPDLIPWLDEVRGRGLLRRLTSDDQSAEALLHDALTVLMKLPAPDTHLPHFATTTLGDSHALDADKPVTGLVLRALSSRAGLSRWDDAESRREAWASAGVVSDELSAPVLVLNLRVIPSNSTGRQVALLAGDGEPTFITVRQLLRCPPEFEPGEGRTVFVCENPTVIAGAANALGPQCAPLVCIQGQPKTSTRLLLNQLTNAGWQPAYHGDFDWPGIQIANSIIVRHHAIPWRMSAADYSSATPSSVELAGPRFVPTWDPLLADCMNKSGYAILEEQVLDFLFDDLRQRGPATV